MQAYPHFRKLRITPDEIVATFTERTGYRLVVGFEKLREQGDAIPGGERVAGYLELWGRTEWYLPLSAQQGLTWETASVTALDTEKVAFLFATGFGNGSPLPQPSGCWQVWVNDQYALSVRMVKHDQYWQEGECSLAFSANRIEAAPPFGSLCLSSVLTAESAAAFGPAVLTVPSAWLCEGEPAIIRVVPETAIHSTRWFHLMPAQNALYQSNLSRVVQLLTQERTPRTEGYAVYFGDIHTHSGEVDANLPSPPCGLGTRKENYRFARGAGGLDFYALTDHERQVSQDRTAQYFGLADQFQEEGRFVCLPAYEFTSQYYGHRNVYFRHAGTTLVDAIRQSDTLQPGESIAVTPDELWQQLEAGGIPFFTVPHHPSSASHPCTWDYYHPQYDRLVEVYSCWGSSEYLGDYPRGVSDRHADLSVRAALNRGCRMGMIASADGHDGHPGDAQSPFRKHHHLFHSLGSGFAAVLCEELTREAVFNALFARRCYATTGVPIVLSVTLNGHVMGSELPPLPAGHRPALQVTCTGTNSIDHIRVMKNGRVVATELYHGERCALFDWEDSAYQPGEASYYYVRVVQIDRESAWSSPIWVG